MIIGIIKLSDGLPSEHLHQVPGGLPTVRAEQTDVRDQQRRLGDADFHRSEVRVLQRQHQRQGLLEAFRETGSKRSGVPHESGHQTRGFRSWGNNKGNPGGERLLANQEGRGQVFQSDQRPGDEWREQKGKQKKATAAPSVLL